MMKQFRELEEDQKVRETVKRLVEEDTDQDLALQRLFGDTEDRPQREKDGEPGPAVEEATEEQVAAPPTIERRVADEGEALGRTGQKKPNPLEAQVAAFQQSETPSTTTLPQRDYTAPQTTAAVYGVPSEVEYKLPSAEFLLKEEQRKGKQELL